MLASRAETPSVASRTRRLTSAASRCLRAMMTESFSAMRRVLPLRRMPAVSTKRKSCAPRVTTSSTASRVVPAMGLTMARALPVRALSKVDLPTLGRPMMAILVSCSTNAPWERRRRGGLAVAVQVPPIGKSARWIGVTQFRGGAGGRRRRAGQDRRGGRRCRRRARRRWRGRCGSRGGGSFRRRERGRRCRSC